MVLLLHGQPGGAADWAGVLAGLDGRAEALATDRPGWDGATPARDLAGNAAAALSALDERRAERAVVVGHSLGAAVAAWLAATAPNRVSALILAAPAANLAALYPLDRWLAAPVAGEVAAGAILGGLGLALAAAPVRARIARRSRLDDAYLRAAGTAARRPSAWRAYIAEQRALIRDLPELERRLGAITAPTTIIAGTHDRVVPARAVQRLRQQIPGARLRRSAAAGHLVPQRDPQAVVSAILTALGDCATL
ncbi:MAG TPA: alpha/beta hydrolase [Solirubrobacteraceae bacterium]|nr:alpha/beta hydrolase [Solirubrobacteraceae bacterium]